MGGIQGIGNGFGEASLNPRQSCFTSLWERHESIAIFSLTSYVQIVDQTRFFVLVQQPVKEKENSEFKLAELHLKIYLVLHFAHSREVG